jgi:lysophospholipase L1-like esterase
MTAATTQVSVRFAALGDSITVGMGDPLPGGGWRGFAPLLAESLPAAEFRNFASSGAQTLHVATEQLAAALRWRPQIATVLAGVNDTLRGSFDIAAIGARLHCIVDGLRGAGAVVVTVCLPEPGRMLRLPEALARPLARRVNAINDIIEALTVRYRTAHVHISDDHRVWDRRMWSVDRLHPSEFGHRWLAGRCYDALHQHGVELGQRPSAEPLNPAPTARSQLWWMATKGTRWVLRRSTDLLPQLVSLAASEWRGLSSELDLRMALEVESILADFG